MQFLTDIRLLEAEGLQGTYSYALEYLNFEQYVVFIKETLISTGLSFLAVIFVIIFITASWPVTFLVTMSVLLVDFFIVALVHYWNLTFNNIVVVQVVIAIGLSVDFSAHIAHTYLVIKPPKRCKTD